MSPVSPEKRTTFLVTFYSNQKHIYKVSPFNKYDHNYILPIPIYNKKLKQEVQCLLGSSSLYNVVFVGIRIRIVVETVFRVSS